MARLLSNLLVGSLLVVGAAQKQVMLDLFYESCCPFCQNYIINELAPLWRNPEWKQYLGIHWVAFGMGQVAMNGVMNCQHGPDECVGNRVQICAEQKLGRDTDALTDFIICMEQKLVDTNTCAMPGAINNPALFEECAPGQVQDFFACAGDDSRSLPPAKQAAQDTQAVAPTKVPWCTLSSLTSYNLFGEPLKGTLCQRLAQDGVQLQDCMQLPQAPYRRLREGNATLV